MEHRPDAGTAPERRDGTDPGSSTPGIAPRFGVRGRRLVKVRARGRSGRRAGSEGLRRGRNGHGPRAVARIRAQNRAEPRAVSQDWNEVCFAYSTALTLGESNAGRPWQLRNLLIGELRLRARNDEGHGLRTLPVSSRPRDAAEQQPLRRHQRRPPRLAPVEDRPSRSGSLQRRGLRDRRAAPDAGRLRPLGRRRSEVLRPSP